MKRYVKIDIDSLEAELDLHDSEMAKVENSTIPTGALALVVVTVTAIAAGYQIYVTPLSALISEVSFWLKVLILMVFLSIRIMEYHSIRLGKELERKRLLTLLDTLTTKDPAK